MAHTQCYKSWPVIIKYFKELRVHSFHKSLARSVSSYRDTFKFSDLKITLAAPHQQHAKPDPSNLVFGKCFADHMFQVKWTSHGGWGIPQICPLQHLTLHPASKVLHYSQELFEGMKAFQSADKEVLLFRPLLNIQRMLSTAERASLPLFDGEEFLKCLKKLVSIDRDWVPDRESCSLYVRPTFIGIEPSLGVAPSKEALLYIINGPVGSYFATGIRQPVSLYADPQYVRAWMGGVGDKKMGSNYGPTLYVQKIAEKLGHQQVLWLYGEDQRLTEVGGMNIFVYLINEQGDKELVTPPLNGIILPGVVRQSLLDLSRQWNEFKVSERPITMKEVISAVKEKRLLEIFGSGTACVVCPVSSIGYAGEKLEIPTMASKDALNTRFFHVLSDIQTGKIKSDWSVAVN